MTGAVGLKPVNFAGSSVERAESQVLRGDVQFHGVDLPGIASLDPLTRDEQLAIDALRGPDALELDVIVAVLDASRLSVELPFFQQLAVLGIPIVVALNKADVVESQGLSVDGEALEAALGVPLVTTQGRSGAGIDALFEALQLAAESPAPDALDLDWEDLTARVIRGERVGISTTDRVDAILLHRVWGLPILVALLYGVFQAIFLGAEPAMGWIESGQGLLSVMVASWIAPGALQSLFIDGIINGMGSVVIFLPQIILMMLFIVLLEGSGYLARAAFLLDRPLSRVGLSGRSFIPLMGSFGCAVPGILATRIMEGESDRLATIAVAPLMSCSARFPVYVVLIGAFFPASMAGGVLFGLYALGIGVAAFVAWILRRTVLKGRHSVLLMELPPYQLPPLSHVLGSVLASVKAFVVMAGTVIFLTSLVIWALSYYPRPMAIHAEHEALRAEVIAEELEDSAAKAALARIDAAEDAAYFEDSYMAGIGKTVQPVFAPAGFDWRITVGILAAFPARELIIPTLGTLYSLGELDPGVHDLTTLEEGAAPPDGLREKLRAARDSDGNRVFDPVVALALMVFFALCSQCVATLAAMRRETASWRWPVFAFTYMTALAWIAAVAVHQVGRWMGWGA
jgi:ferrous iron transport protein B